MKPLNILWVDASDEMLHQVMAAAGADRDKLVCERVDTGHALEAALKTGAWDAVVSQVTLPELSGVTAMALVQRLCPDIPFIVLDDDPEMHSLVEELIKAGANNRLKCSEAGQFLPLLHCELLQAEMRRRRSEGRRFQELLANSSDAISVLDAGGTIQYQSPGVSRLLGYGAEALAGRNVFDLVSPEDAPVLRGCFGQELGAPVTARVAMRHENGSWRQLEVTGRNLLVDPAIRGVILNARDITEQLQTERELELQRARLTAIMATVEDTAWSLSSPDFNFIYVSPGADRLLGRPAELSGQPLERWLRWVEPADRPRVQSAVEELVNRRTLEVEYRINRPDREVKWVRSRGWTVRNDAGEVVRFDGITTDITERKNAEEALRRSEERFQFAARATREVIRDWNLSTDEIWWNESVQSQFHHPMAQVGRGIGWWVGNLHVEDREHVVASIRDVIDNGHRLWLGEYRFRRGDGSYADIVDRAFVLRDQGGKPVRLIGSMMDVTETKRLEAKYLRAQRMETVGTLAGGVAHDLNNVLTPILMSVQLLLENDRREETASILKAIESSARRGASVVKQLLTFAKGIEGERVPLRLNNIMLELENLVHETFPKNIGFDLRLEPELWNVEADPTQLHQVLLNFCVNARDAMPEGGTLRISAENAEIDEQYCAMHLQARPGRFVRISVEDTGIGMLKEISDRIFEPFFTTKSAGRGTGLGLSTVLGIVKSHRGFMDLHSELNKGTRFNVFIPAVAAHEVSPEADASGLPPCAQGELVLLVDDEQSITHLGELTLKRAGYRVITAQEGADAIARYAQHQSEIAMVVIDMKMPVMDGPAAVRVLRRMNPHLKIIGTSGSLHGDTVSAIQALELDAFITKPYTGEKLLRELNRVLHDDVVIENLPERNAA